MSEDEVATDGPAGARSSEPPPRIDSVPLRRTVAHSGSIPPEGRESYLPEEPEDPPSALGLAGCFGVVGALLCGLEALFAGARLADLWLAAALGLFASTLLGVAIAAATIPPLRYLPRAGPLVAMLAGALAGVPFVGAPGMFEPLLGANGRVVWAALVVGPFAGALTGFVVGRAVQQRSMFFATVLSILALGLLFLEPRLVAMPAYPAAAWGLRLIPWGAGALALHQLRRRNAPPASRRTKAVLVGTWVLLTASPWLAAGRGRGDLDVLLALRHPELAVRLVRALSDFDGDGFSSLFGGGDCDDGDAQIHPRAPEIAGNGVDDDCRGGDRAPNADREAAPAAPTELASLPEVPSDVSATEDTLDAAQAETARDAPATETADEPALTSVVLVTVGALRVDRVGAYGYVRPTTPSFDELASRGRRFERAFAAGSGSTVSLPALLYAAPARTLRFARLFATDERLVEASALDALGPTLRVKSAVLVPRDPRPSLAERLAARGYQTLAVVDSGGRSFFLEGRGLARGFQRYDTSPFDDDTAVADRSLALLRESRGRPFFLWAYFYGPNPPDRRHADAPDFGGGSSERYDHEIAHADVQVGRILAAIADRPDVVVIVTADHGESLGPLTRTNGNDLHPNVSRVPLIVAGAGVERGVEPEAVGLVDVASTVLAVAGLSHEGADLRAAVPTGRRVLVDTWRFDPRGRAIVDQAGVATADELVIRDRLLQVDYAVDPDDLGRVPTRRTPQTELVRALDRYLEDAEPLPRTQP